MKTIKNFGKKSNEGITLISLVVTIIILIILAAVSINLVLGQNGLITRTQTSGREYEKAGIIETIRNDIYVKQIDKLKNGQDGKLTESELNAILKGHGDVNGENFAPTGKNYEIPIVEIYNEGFATEKDKTVADIQGEKVTENTVVEDEYGNKITVPGGFEITSDADTVPEGIVITDGTNEFVWIPVGTVTNGTKTVTIELSRYTFAEGETPTKQGANKIGDFQELETSTYGNSTSKNLQGFISSANTNGGYYIGRYEARDAEALVERGSSSSETNKVVINGSGIVYNSIRQTAAADLCRNMYSSSNFESDLANSYAWDTALVFLQEFDNRLDKTYPYALINSINSLFAERGTNNTGTSDKICNIYDMMSNTPEWTTETSTLSGYPWTSYGGTVFSGGDGKGRNGRMSREVFTKGENAFIVSIGETSFRPIIYM